MGELNLLADALERFSDVGVVGYSIAVFGLIVTGWLYTKAQVNDIRSAYEARLASERADNKERVDRLERVLDDYRRPDWGRAEARAAERAE